MTIQILPGERYLVLAGDAPEAGRIYALERADTPTARQNKAFHALVQEYWKSGAHSYPAKTFAEFRDFIKRDLGAGFESYVYASAEGIKKAATWEEIPSEYRNKQYALGKLKSWADYSKKERRDAIDRLISTMDQAGVNTRKYQEIIAGLNESRRS